MQREVQMVRNACMPLALHLLWRPYLFRQHFKVGVRIHVTRRARRVDWQLIGELGRRRRLAIGLPTAHECSAERGADEFVRRMQPSHHKRSVVARRSREAMHRRRTAVAGTAGGRDIRSKHRWRTTMQFPPKMKS